MAIKLFSNYFGGVFFLFLIEKEGEKGKFL